MKKILILFAFAWLLACNNSQKNSRKVMEMIHKNL